jgi:hypothetical protein
LDPSSEKHVRQYTLEEDEVILNAVSNYAGFNVEDASCEIWTGLVDKLHRDKNNIRRRWNLIRDSETREQRRAMWSAEMVFFKILSLFLKLFLALFCMF